MKLLKSSLLACPLLFFSLPTVFAQGNTACRAGATDMDWYTKTVGETPCRTYERLRQICDSNYRVGTFSTTSSPGDFCDSQVADCCCNSVAFALSMLCQNCQRNLNSAIGIDAPKGTWQAYIDGSRNNNCKATIHALPDGIQQATCRQDMKIFNGLYGLFWYPGDWFYTYTRQSLTKDFNVQGPENAFKCTKTKEVPVTPQTSTTTSTSTATSTATVTTEQTQTASPTQEETSTPTPTGISKTTSLSTATKESGTSSGSPKAGLVGSTTPIDGQAATVPTSTSTNNDSLSTPAAAVAGSSNSMSGGAIAGIAFGGIVVLGGLCFLAFLIWRRSQSKQARYPGGTGQVMPYIDNPTIYNDQYGEYPAAHSMASLTPNRGPMMSSTSRLAYMDSDENGSSSGRTGGSLAPSSDHRRPYSLSASSNGGRMSPTSTSVFTESDAGPVRPEYVIPGTTRPPVYDERWRESQNS